ncbi:MAG: transglycosylase SLT domain-containing protein [Nitrospiraceae bacterium]|nr:transglycosylase SLT domain-containing protein [Nitrospiraceae bacterium]
MGIEAARNIRLPEDAIPSHATIRSCNAGNRTLCAFIVVLMAVCFLPAVVRAEDGKEYLKKGKSALDAGRYEEAVKKLPQAVQEFPILGDYALLYLAEAYHNIGDHSKSLDAVRTLLKKYPESPLIRRARATEIREAGENTGEDLSKIFDAYVKDYPGDEQMHFMYGLYLKRSGNEKRAKEVFRGIYVKAGPLSGSAYSELDPAELSAGDFVERALNLMKQYKFGKAELELRKALAMGVEKNRDEVLRNLGLAMFRQKEYREAAAIYAKIDDTYSSARSLYRAGDREGFESALKALVDKHDTRVANLLLSQASDKRRDGDTGGALKVYDEIISKYPLEQEDATWGMGWTRFIAGQYKESGEVFSKLYAQYEDPKYLYWQARSKEALGEDAKDLYQALLQYNNNFYVALSAARGKVRAGGPVSAETAEAATASDKKFERVDALLSLGMTKEAGGELQWITKRIDSPATLVAVAARFQKIGDFRHAISLAARMPYSEKMHRFWYPLAFRKEVEEVSRKNGIDPMVALSVMREESRFDPDARSVAGARGLMQLMPRTAYRLDRKVNVGISNESGINDVATNIRLGVYYLKSLFDEFGSLPHVLAAYNAGEAAVKRWWGKGNYRAVDEFIEDIPYPETRHYVKKVITSYYQYKKFSPSESASTASVFGTL